MLQAFEQFLISKEGVLGKNAPYYVKWVSDCYRFVDKPETQPLTNEQTAEFREAKISPAFAVRSINNFGK